MEDGGAVELLAPWSLAGLALVPAIFLWGLLAPRGRPIVVGSLMLWRRALGGGPAGRPSARVRLGDPLLWLDASAVLLLILACSRPAVRTTAPAEPVVTFVIDRTASMETSSAGQRWRQARDMAQPVLEGIGQAPIRVVSVPDAGGEVSAVPSPADALRASARASLWQPVPAARDIWPTVLAEAAARPDLPVVVTTDVAPTVALPRNVHVLATGGTSANAGLERVAARIEGRRWWLLVAARAAPGAPGTYAMEASDPDAGGALVSKPAFLAPGATAETVFAMDGPPPRTLRVALQGPDDGFPADSAACLAREPARRVRVLLVGKGDPALRRALAAREDTVVVETPAEARPPLGETDLVIACGAALPAEWKGPAVVVLPPETVGPVRPMAGEVSAEWRVAAGHPLAGAFYLGPPRIGNVRRCGVDAAAELLLGTPEAPLMVTWEADGARRLAVLFAFDEPAADWARRAGFPVFWSRAIDWLVPGERRGTALVTYRPFETVPGRSGPAPAACGFHEGEKGQTIGTSFIGTDEGFQAGPGRDDSAAAVAAVRASAEARRRASDREIWPYVAAIALAAVALRAWLAR